MIQIPEGKDAADAVKEDPQLWRDAAENKTPYLKFFLDKYKKEFDLSLPTSKKAFTDAFFEILKGTRHPVEKDHYIKEVSRLVGTPAQMLYDLLNQRIAGERQHRKVERQGAQEKKSRQARLLDEFLGLLLAYPKTFFEVFEGIKDFDSFRQKADAIGLVRQLTRLNNEDYRSFYDGFDAFLGEMDSELDASRVYKQVRDHYNLRGELDEGFYRDAENAKTLHILALGAEEKNSQEKLVPLEFEKLMVHLYLEFVTSIKS